LLFRVGSAPIIGKVCAGKTASPSALPGRAAFVVVNRFRDLQLWLAPARSGVGAFETGGSS
jgi:hypothetical protein